MRDWPGAWGSAPDPVSLASSACGGGDQAGNREIFRLTRRAFIVAGYAARPDRRARPLITAVTSVANIVRRYRSLVGGQLAGGHRPVIRPSTRGHAADSSGLGGQHANVFGIPLGTYCGKVHRGHAVRWGRRKSQVGHTNQPNLAVRSRSTDRHPRAAPIHGLSESCFASTPPGPRTVETLRVSAPRCQHS